MIIWQLDVVKWEYTERKNWLAINDQSDPFDYIDDEKDESYTILFSSFDEMSKYIDKITEGYEQYWGDILNRTDGNKEILEYHNGHEWDKEMHLETKKVRVHDSLINVIKEMS